MASEQGYVMAYEETQNEAVLKVEVVKSGVSKLVVKHLSTGEEEEIEKDEFFPLDLEAERGSEDLAQLQTFNEAALLINLQSRYTAKEIYTNLNSTLIMINPYAPNPRLSSRKKVKRYWKYSTSSLDPHIFSTGKTAYLALFYQNTSQVILISGESGAGKTESTKHLLKFLSSHNSAEFEEIEKKIVQSGPILEAFGNSKTVKNNNSSRFGKFVKLYYDENKVNIKSASIESFLLEKSRVVRHGPGEENFHIFYLMCANLQGVTLKELGLTENEKVDFRDFRYLVPFKSSFSGDVVEESKGFEVFSQLMEAFEVNSFSEYETTAIWKVLAGILHIGNIEFDDSEYSENNPCSLVDISSARKAAKVLEVPLNDLISSMTTIKRLFDKSEIVSPVNKSTCEGLRDTLAKLLYERVFNWVLKKLNQGLKGREGLFIGILDIYGFEVFKNNSFEQLCINYANEKLQQLSIHYTFKAEIEEMKQENLEKKIPLIQFSDNQPILDLLESSPNGIFRLIDEACAVKTNEEVLLSSIKSKHKDNELLVKDKKNSATFTVNHTAAPVTYDIEGFISKNVDEVRPEFEVLVQGSENKLVKLIFRAESGKGKFVSDKFRKEIHLLMSEIEKSVCWFVKCIKPNEKKTPWDFQQRTVLNQIQYLGLLDSIMIRKKGFQVRIQHKQFFELYKILENYKFTDTIQDYKRFSEQLMNSVNNPGLIVGKTKVFIKQEIEEILKQIKKEKISLVENAAVKVQRWFRSKKNHLKFKNLVKSVRKIQSNWKKFKNRKRFLVFKERTVFIQKWYRSILYKEQNAIREFGLQIFYQYLKIKIEDFFLEKCFNLAIKAQKLYRGHRTRRLLKGKRLINKIFFSKVYRPTFEQILIETKEASALKIQKKFRGYLVRTRKTQSITSLLQKNKQNRMATRIQKWFKGQIICKKLKKIKYACIKIQSFHRAQGVHKNYLKTLSSISIIQRFFRSYLIRSKAIKSRLSDFLTKEQALTHNLSLLENSEIFSTVKPEDNYLSQQVLRSLSNLQDSNHTKESSLSIQSRPVTPFHIEKIYFFTRIFDLELLFDQSVVYEPLWTLQLESLNKELIQKEEFIMDLAIGNCHSLALTSKGRIFTWGWNDKNQCGALNPKPRSLEFAKDVKFIQISSGDDHSLALTTSGQVFAFGDNSKGQLGQGNYFEYKSGIILDVPACKQIVAVSNQNMAVTLTGELFIWPFETVLGEKRSFPMKMLYDYTVQEVSVGYNFAMILATSGIVFSLGSNNQSGQLGHGDLLPRSSPTMILALKKIGEKVGSISCGQKHVIAKSTLGKIFTWGCGGEGQLGQGSVSNELVPRLVGFKGNLKPVQIAAGYQHSIVMLENRKIMVTGRSSNGNSSSFGEVSIANKLPELFLKTGEFAVVKISSIWSRGIVAMMVTIADLRYMQVGNGKVVNGLGQLAAKWNHKSIEPPNIESISGYFPTGLSKKGARQPMQKNGKIKQMEEFKDKISEILRKPGEKWTAEEKHTMEHFTKVAE